MDPSENPNFQQKKNRETASWDSDPYSVVGCKLKREEIQETLKINSSGCGGEIAKIDSGGCGDEIAKIDSGGCGDESAKIDSVGDSAVAEEKKTREVDDFTDTYGIIRRYDAKMGFEYEGFDPLRAYGPDNPFKEGTNYYDMDDYSSSSDDDDDEKKKKKKAEKPPFDTTDLIKYITQLRNSFGFDVDVILPSWLMHTCMLYLVPIDASLPNRNKTLYKALKIAIDEINVDMEFETQKNKTYEAVELVKAVTTIYPFLLTFLTLDVKEAETTATKTIQAIIYRPMHEPWQLQQWRFKPDAAKA